MKLLKQKFMCNFDEIVFEFCPNLFLYYTVTLNTVVYLHTVAAFNSNSSTVIEYRPGTTNRPGPNQNGTNVRRSASSQFLPPSGKMLTDSNISIDAHNLFKTNFRFYRLFYNSIIVLRIKKNYINAYDLCKTFFSLLSTLL